MEAASSSSCTRRGKGKVSRSFWLMAMSPRSFWERSSAAQPAVTAEEEISSSEKKTVRFSADEKEGKDEIKNLDQTSVKAGGSRNLGKTKHCSINHGDRSAWILDPGGNILLIWNRAFLTCCLLSQCIDPLFFFLPVVDNTYPYLCLRMDRSLSATLTLLRSLVDVFYVIDIAVKFRTAYVDPVSKVLGKGELVMDPRKITDKYIRTYFFIDLVAALPLPQILVWLVMPSLSFKHSNDPYLLIILVQSAIRLYLIIPLSKTIIKVIGFITKSAWEGAMYNLLLYMVASHVIGAIYYLLAVERQATCWESQCLIESRIPKSAPCDLKFLDCRYATSIDGQNWANNTNVFTNCNAGSKGISINYGIFLQALQNGAAMTSLSEKFFYCLWWGLQQLTTYGNPLVTSSFVGENLFSIALTTLSIGMFAQLIGSMQIYIRSLSANAEEWRRRQRETEDWMKDHQLPDDLQRRMCEFLRYKWIMTQGVDEDSILRQLPADLRRNIQQHLCLDLVRRVPFFSEMDQQLLDAICERMTPILRTEGTYIIQDGEPVKEMLFIIRGKLESSTSNGGRVDFFNSTILKPGDFCGEEVLTWALLPNSGERYPSSTRTIRTVAEMEGFALQANDLKSVANMFRKLHSKQLQHTFRFYSHHWRTWAACSIQSAWQHYRNRQKMAAVGLSSRWESFFSLVDERINKSTCEDSTDSSSSVTQGAAMIASVFRRAQKERPEEPDFSAEHLE